MFQIHYVNEKIKRIKKAEELKKLTNTFFTNIFINRNIVSNKFEYINKY